MRILFSIILALTPSFLSAQTNISGVINSYYEVVSVDAASDCVELDPLAATGLNINDRVLLIQMQGATMSQLNNATFGTLSLLNGVGAYEIGIVCSVSGTTICFQYDLINTYNQLASPDAKIQLIPIPSYPGDVNVTGTLTGDAWDGDVGGVLIFEAAGDVTLNADIDMSGKGFRGGAVDLSGFGCSFAAVQNDFFYDITTGRGAWKGEGIVPYIAGQEAGAGAQSNGGGGGNDHNTGGGGGANYGSGGQGGTFGNAGFFDCKGNTTGRPGYLLSGFGYTLVNNNIFMGGGGGSGHSNNVGEGEPGANGGGIIIIIADEVNGNGFSIMADGNDALDSGSDGAPGGGAGGAILINSNSFSANALALSAKGGNGGNSSTVGVDCMGPGGGGGGGAIWTFAALGGGTTTDVTAGTNGIVQIAAATPPACNGNTNGATSGIAGLVQTGLDIPEETVNAASCILAPLNLTFQATPKGHHVVLDWQLDNTADYQSFIVERRTLSSAFTDLIEITVDPEQINQGTFDWVDRNVPLGLSTYRLRLVNESGSISHSRQVEVRMELAAAGFDLLPYPNPGAQQEARFIELILPQAGKIDIQISTMEGKSIFHSHNDLPAGIHQLELPIQDLPAGSYLIMGQSNGERVYRKWILY